MRGILLAAALLAACSQQAPEVLTLSDDEPTLPVETRSSVDRAIATTGDVITYTVTVDYDPAYEIELPEPGADIAGFRIVDIGSEEPRDKEGRRIEERWYKLRADLVGSYVLPPVQVAYRPDPSKSDVGTSEVGVPETETEDAETGDAETADGEGSEAAAPLEGADLAQVEGFETVETSEIFIEVQSVLPGDGEVSDIRGLKPLRQVVTPAPWWWFAAGGGAVLALGLLGFVLWRRSQRTVALPPRPAHEIAYEALERLRQTDFEDVEAMRLFHFEISEVIRAYVENRFTLNATDLTTEEIVAVLDGVRGLSDGESQRLRRFLQATDQVKFAAYVPREEEITETYEGALSFVEATRERPEGAAAEAVPANQDSFPEEAAA